METTTKNQITVETIVKAPVEKVWKTWNEPEHIMGWCRASDDWHAPASSNDIRTGGKFSTTMAAKDGSFSFDFAGVYDNVKENELIQYTIADGRKVEVIFTKQGNDTKVVETFDAENAHSLEMQKGGWQAILDNYKKYTESV
jgi:uncharacterized protein YndB with AHSA1/START domain